MTKEVWKQVFGFDGYEVSNRGRVKSWQRVGTYGKKPKNGRLLRPSLTPYGYRFVRLTRNGKSVSIHVHKLVLEAFICKMPEGKQCAHRNADREDNRLENLRWVTQSENEADKVELGISNRGERCGNARLTRRDVLSIRRDVRRNFEIAKDYGVHRITIHDIKNRRTWAWL